MNRGLVLPGKFKAAVFDFDGLLVDSEPGWQRAETLLLERHGGVFTEADAHGAVGRSIDQSVIEYGARLGLASESLAALHDELIDLAKQEYQRGFALCPGALELVAALRGRVPLALASNTERELIQLGLTLSPFGGCFEVIVTRDDVQQPKPAPDLYALACQRLGVQPREAVAFEDSVPGVTAAKDAGLTVVAVRQAPDSHLDGADVVVESLSDLIVG
jgi:HAD superfamily hydrolase (TIGR01509 family)